MGAHIIIQICPLLVHETHLYSCPLIPKTHQHSAVPTNEMKRTPLVGSALLRVICYVRHIVTMAFLIYWFTYVLFTC